MHLLSHEPHKAPSYQSSNNTYVAMTDHSPSVRVVARGRSAALEIKAMVKVARTARQQALRPVNVSFTA
jgi:hypothetical protein